MSQVSGDGTGDNAFLKIARKGQSADSLGLVGWRKEIVEELEKVLAEARSRPAMVIIRWDEQGAFIVQVAAPPRRRVVA